MVRQRDFTDYRGAIHGAGEHTITYFHVQFLPKKKDAPKQPQRTLTCMDLKETIVLPAEAELPSIKYNNFKYLFESQRDRAYQTKKAAWKKWFWKDPIKSFKEIFRSKKIGYTIYHEPCDHKCSKCPKKGENNCPSEYVEAFHHSVIRQPSGHLRTDPLRYIRENGIDRIEDVEVVTPFMLKVRIENRFYRDQFRTVKYGNLKGLVFNWKIWLIIGAVAVFLLLYLTGSIPGLG